MGHQYYHDDNSPNSSMDHGIVVELPDGKLFKLSDPNGRVVEMPNGSIVEMLDGQVVEMSNGQRLHMIDGNLVETRPAYFDIPSGEVVGHRVLTDEEVFASSTSKKGNIIPPPILTPALTAAPTPTPKRQDSNNLLLNNQTGLPLKPLESSTLSHDRTEVDARESERIREKERAAAEKEKALAMKQQQLAALEKEVEAKLQQLRQREDLAQRQQSALAYEKEEIKRRELAAQVREGDARALEAAVLKSKQELASKEAAIRDKEALVRERELELQRASSSSTIATYGKREESGALESTGNAESCLDNIEAGRIRFSELSLGPLLGSGSFADVYRSEWRMPCAIKKMKGRLTKEQMTEFVREGEMMRALRHPGIVKLLGVCVENGNFYLIQEIVNGHGNLFDYLHKPPVNRLTYWQVVQIAAGISDAMTYLHERSIVHRDLKPQNCLLINDKGQVKLCDFGLARLKRTAYVETISNSAGTPAYQAPEMLRDEPISEKVDLYGFGIMLWEMQTGKLPWSDKNYHQMIHTVAVRNERPPITADIPQELVQMIEHCWHAKPDVRPKFADLKVVLKKLAESLPCDITVPKTPSKAEQPQSSSYQHGNRDPSASRFAHPSSQGYPQISSAAHYTGYQQHQPYKAW